MAERINLNADIAEGWGAYDIGNDAALMKIIKSASVACGFHAGDPNTMHRLCTLAKQEGASTDRDLIYVALYGSQMEKAAEKLGLRLAREGFADRKYDDDGNLASRAIPGTVLKDPQAASEHALRMVREGEVVSMSGKRVKVEVDTFCAHGDEATGVEIAGAVRKALEAANIEVVPLTAMQL